MGPAPDGDEFTLVTTVQYSMTTLRTTELEALWVPREKLRECLLSADSTLCTEHHALSLSSSGERSQDVRRNLVCRQAGIDTKTKKKVKVPTASSPESCDLITSNLKTEVMFPSETMTFGYRTRRRNNHSFLHIIQ